MIKLTDKEEAQLQEMREHLGKLHEDLWNDPDFDGHCKMNEGYVGLLFRFDNWHECDGRKDYETKSPQISMVEVYSYLFGPSRLHTFETVEDAHKEVISW